MTPDCPNHLIAFVLIVIAIMAVVFSYQLSEKWTHFFNPIGPAKQDFHQGQFLQVETKIFKVLAKPTSPDLEGEARLLLAKTYVALGRFQEAHQEIVTALELIPVSDRRNRKEALLQKTRLEHQVR